MKHFKTLPIPYDPAALLLEYYKGLEITGFSEKVYIDTQFEFINVLKDLELYPESKRIYGITSELFGTATQYGFLYMRPKKVYGHHRDDGFVIHFPVVTNSECRMIIEDEQMHLPIGVCTLVNSRGLHTVYNAGNEMRVHLAFGVDREGSEIVRQKYFPFSEEPRRLSPTAMY